METEAVAIQSDYCEALLAMNIAITDFVCSNPMP